MLKNYFLTALRNLMRHKANAGTNIAGLTVGFAAFLLIFIIVQYEQSFDTFHKNKNYIYRVVRVGRNPANREYRTGVPFPVTPALRLDFPQLANVSSIMVDGDAQVLVPTANGQPQKKFKESSGLFFAEPQFFKMFDFPMVQGDIKTALNEPNTALFTKDLADKYFGDWRTAMGKTLTMDGQPIKVTGILENPPANTDFPIKGVLSYVTLEHYANMRSWGGINDDNYCFVQVAANSSPAQVQLLLDQFVEKHIKSVNPGYILQLQPLKEMHYDERYGNFTGRTFSKDLTLALSLIGLFLLIVACVNFINLTTAYAVTRAREVGVRKVMGSRRSQLIFQFLGETGIVSFLALVAAIVIAIGCIPLVDNLLNVHISADVLFTGQFALFTFTAFVAVTLLSGFYPALILSGFKPAIVLKSAISTDNKKGVLFRRGLVVFQFVIAQALVVATLVVVSQMDYFRNADLGFKKDAIINAGIPGDSLSRTKIDIVRTQLAKVAGVEDISLSSGPPSGGGGWYTDLRLPGNNSNTPDMVINIKPCDTSFFRLYGLQLAAGRIYYSSDTVREFVVNETVVRKLGIRHTADAIGKLVNVNGTTGPIVGVVKDFHNNSLRDPIGPVVFTTIRDAYGLVNIKINLTQATPVVTAMENIWNKYFPDYSFEYNFLDQSIATFYEQENQLSKLYSIFSAIAIFISCLGLYGLISFMVVQRKKEIGIRKVLGAPVQNIVLMLSKEFTVLITIAFVIASPIAWYFMHDWLQQYTYRISMGIWFFIATIAGSLGIAWLTVGYRAVKAATENPVKSLRTE